MSFHKYNLSYLNIEPGSDSIGSYRSRLILTGSIASVIETGSGERVGITSLASYPSGYPKSLSLRPYSENFILIIKDLTGAVVQSMPISEHVTSASSYVCYIDPISSGSEIFIDASVVAGFSFEVFYPIVQNIYDGSHTARLINEGSVNRSNNPSLDEFFFDYDIDYTNGILYWYGNTDFSDVITSNPVMPNNGNLSITFNDSLGNPTTVDPIIPIATDVEGPSIDRHYLRVPFNTKEAINTKALRYRVIDSELSTPNNPSYYRNRLLWRMKPTVLFSKNKGADKTSLFSDQTDPDFYYHCNDNGLISSLLGDNYDSNMYRYWIPNLRYGSDGQLMDSRIPSSERALPFKLQAKLYYKYQLVQTFDIVQMGDSSSKSVQPEIFLDSEFDSVLLKEISDLDPNYVGQYDLSSVADDFYVDIVYPIIKPVYSGNSLADPNQVFTVNPDSSPKLIDATSITLEQIKYFDYEYNYITGDLVWYGNTDASAVDSLDDSKMPTVDHLKFEYQLNTDPLYFQFHSATFNSLDYELSSISHDIFIEIPKVYPGASYPAGSDTIQFSDSYAMFKGINLIDWYRNKEVAIGTDVPFSPNGTLNRPIYQIQQNIELVKDELENRTLLLGEGINDAFRGDLGKAAYDHTNKVGENIHGVTHGMLSDKGTLSHIELEAQLDLINSKISDLGLLDSTTTKTRFLSASTGVTGISTTLMKAAVYISGESQASGNYSSVSASFKSDAGGYYSNINCSTNSKIMNLGKSSQINASSGLTGSCIINSPNTQINASTGDTLLTLPQSFISGSYNSNIKNVNDAHPDLGTFKHNFIIGSSQVNIEDGGFNFIAGSSNNGSASLISESHYSYLIGSHGCNISESSYIGAISSADSSVSGLSSNTLLLGCNGVSVSNVSNSFIVGASNISFSGNTYDNLFMGGTNIVVDDGSGSPDPNLGGITWKLNMGTGDLDLDGTATSNGFDFAEMFESLSGESIPSGSIVVLDGDKIRACDDNDNWSSVIGIISETASVVLNSNSISWEDKYLRTEFGGLVYRDIPDPDYPDRYERNRDGSYFINKDGNKVEVSGWEDKAPKVKAKVLNPEYNLDYNYIPRIERPEWNIVGLIGQIFVKIDSSDIEVGSLVKNGINGRATLSDDYGWKVMKITAPYDKEKGYGVALVLVR